MKRTVIMTCSAFVLAVLTVSAATSFAANAKQAWKEARDAFRVKRYAEALLQFDKAIKENKGEISVEDVAQIFNERGLVYLAQQQYEDALADFDNAVRLGGAKPEFLNNSGMTHFALRQDRDALDDLSKAVRLAPAESSYAMNRGKVYLRMQNYDEAIADFDRVVAIDPRMGAAYLNRGIAYKAKAQYDKAMQSFTKALEVDPADSFAAYQKAAIFSRTGKVDVACTWIEIAGDKGFRDWNLIKNSTDFDGIRRSDCYRAYMKGK